MSDLTSQIAQLATDIAGLHERAAAWTTEKRGRSVSLMTQMMPL